MKLNLKLNTSSNKPPNSATTQPSATASSPPASAPLRINFGGTTPAVATPPTASIPNGQAKTKKQGGKKRQREDDDQTPEAAPKKRQSSVNTIKFGGLTSATTPKTPGSALLPSFKLHTNKKTKLPTRPPGVGYDSEAEDAEDDPAIEENVILRMAPGPDCDYLREAISKGTVGRNPLKEGGAEVYLRFYKNRRAAVVIRGNVYAAVLVDLPCIVESMKSWDKRGWWKSADICQMLLVTEKVPSEKEAETVAMPHEVDEKTAQYPHGLTPPMYNVRRRRFRKRVNHKTIEEAEDLVEELMTKDENVRSQKGGHVEAWTVDLDQVQSQGISSGVEDEDAEGESDYQGQTGELQEGYDMGDANVLQDAEMQDDDEDPEDFAARLAAEFMGDGQDAEEIGQDATEVADTAAELETAQAVIDQAAEPVENGNAESDEDDDDDDDDDEDEGNEEDQEQARLKAQQREEIADLQRDIEKATNDLSQASNPIIRQRFEKRLASLREELASKKRSLGEDPDDDE